jgi:hypothetical protein
MRPFLRPALLAAVAFSSLTLAAQERGGWLASSSNAKQITGDVALSADRITINLISFPIVRTRGLEQAELNAAFDPEKPNGTGSLYRLNVPFSRKFLHKNTLCGSDDTTWMATYATRNSLEIAFYSGDKPPVLTIDALANPSNVCGVFSYFR